MDRNLHISDVMLSLTPLSDCPSSKMVEKNDNSTFPVEETNWMEVFLNNTILF